MKKLIFSGVLTSLLVITSVAFAEPDPVVVPEPGSAAVGAGNTTLTTKKYVDDGLIYVYDKAKTAESTANTAKSTANTAKSTADAAKTAADTALDAINNEETGLKKRVKYLEDNPATYNAGTGIDITNGTVSVDGLDDTKTNNNKDKIYIYKNGALQELPVTNNWNPSILGD